MAETLSTLSLIAFLVSGVSLVTAAVLGVAFKIPTVIGDLSGRTARKSIARMRAANEESGNKSFRSSRTNEARGKLTATMPGTTKEPPETGGRECAEGGGMPETGLLFKAGEARQETETALLVGGPPETEPLEGLQAAPPKRAGGIKLTMIDEEIIIHTDEDIE